MAIGKRRKLIYGCCCLFILRLLCVYIGDSSFLLPDDRVSHVLNSDAGVEHVPGTKRGSDIKTIQWYDVYHNGNGLRCRSHTVDFRRCRYKKCEILDHYLVDPQDDRSPPHGPLQADAVVFQGNHLESLIPPIRRDYSQVFVFAERETWWHLGMFDSMMNPTTPYKSQKYSDLSYLEASVPDVIISPQIYRNVMKFRPLFNWTMTYRVDSDIQMLYGEIIPRKPPKTRPNFHRVYKFKTAEVVWLVSHCITKSKREHYVEQLRQFIPVDVYGGCGELECPRHHGGSCIDGIVRKYKFVLSFENTFHTDYVTEKLFDWFSRDIIQVVYGLADYDRITPPGTVINAANFSSPRNLAQYLHHVGSSQKLYSKYIQNKRQYKVYGHEQMQQRSYCQLCEWLHNANSHRQSYPHIDKWWQVNDTTLYSSLYEQAIQYHKYNYTLIGIVTICLMGIFISIQCCIRHCIRSKKKHFVDD